ncbi:MAG: preprotein translocase subunit SecE [Solirubrobacterales bacterium]|nr:preprotein translocase subunit SecE [Solirubrobacterales bacterium]
MAKSRAQRKAERRAREAAAQGDGAAEAKAQHDTQVPKSGDIAEIEAVEAGIAAGAGEQDLETPDSPKPGLSNKEEKRKARQEEKRKKAEQKKQEEQQLAKRQKQATQTTRKRGGVIAFLSSCIAELKRVQWPDRDTLIQATAVTVVFVLIAAVYLGLLDLFFNWLVQRII